MTISAAVLAGGQSTRFGGRDKSALIVEGQSILDRQLAQLRQLTDDVLIVGRDRAHQGARVVPDLAPGCGPLGGLQTALAEARGDVTIVIACDMHYVSAPLMGHLAALANDADAVVPKTEDGYHPLCAAYTRACLEPIARLLAAGRFRMTELLAQVRLRVVTAGELDRFGDRYRLLTNVNTPAEYSGLGALQGHQL